MAPKKKKEASTSQDNEPMKLFYIFYSQERWDNWIKSLMEADFEGGSGEDDMPEGYQILYSFNQDICLEVLKILKLVQNNRFTKEEAITKIEEVEAIVMGQEETGDLADLNSSLQLSLLVLFASTRKFLEGEYSDDIKALVKKGRGIGDDAMEEMLGVASEIGANVINGKTCCGRFIKDSEDPDLFDEWLIEIELISESMTSLKNFDEEAGEAS